MLKWGEIVSNKLIFRMNSAFARRVMWRRRLSNALYGRARLTVAAIGARPSRPDVDGRQSVRDVRPANFFQSFRLIARLPAGH
ncbi:hypothetical protein GCM10019059_14050 [Camelimonas fluminis]|nr:hypothetical protein GCM10019059_14050 [Camelimonas fluminis]